MTRVTRFANLYGLCDGLHGEPGKCSTEAVNRGREQLIGNANGNAQQLYLDLSTCI
ncbi:hypothetical protein WN944_004695 [Citrus x changshan-huyou]|uniref:Uncharacterized protein n=1 Tax=Citrus x changshan-huyou TaxID=2935761 RepID=A0AAP0QIV8_9ROSI